MRPGHALLRSFRPSPLAYQFPDKLLGIRKKYGIRYGFLACYEFWRQFRELVSTSGELPF